MNEVKSTLKILIRIKMVKKLEIPYNYKNSSNGMFLKLMLCLITDRAMRRQDYL